MNPVEESDLGAVGIYQQMTALAERLGAVNLSQGIPEPVYTAQWQHALSAALGCDSLQYTPTRGTPELLDAVHARYPGVAASAVVTSGCTESVLAVLAALAERGCDTVVLLEPFYSYYPGIVRIAGMTVRHVPVDLSGRTARLDPERLASVLAPLGERGVLLLNTPHNPCGLVLDEAAWAAVLGLVGTHGCHVVVDDVYRDFRYGGPAVPYAALMATGRAAVAGSVSKSYAASGLRLGWLLAPPRLADQAETVHMHLSNCSPAFVQSAAAGILATVDVATLAATAAAYRARRDALSQVLELVGFQVVVPQGGHFVMARPPAGTELLAGPQPSGADIGRALTRAVGVAPLPLDLFFSTPSATPWLRFSFAASDQQMAEACTRLRRHSAAVRQPV